MTYGKQRTNSPFRTGTLFPTLVAAVLFTVSPLAAGVGDEVEVISFDGSFDEVRSVRVAASQGCGFVVAYHAHLREESGYWDILNWGRQFTSNGVPLGPPFQINTDQGDYNDGFVDIDMAPSGSFVTSWHNGNSGLWPHLRIRRFAADATPVGDLITLEDSGDRLHVGMADSGAFVAAHYDPLNTHDYLAGHRFDANGSSVQSPFVVNTHSDVHSAHEVAVNPTGTFVVAWVGSTSPGDDDDQDSIQARCFSASGTPLGDQFQVNTTITDRQFWPRASMADSGAFVIVWESQSSPGSDDSSTSIQMRRFSSACMPIGDQEQVNTYVDSRQDEPDVAVGPNGGFAVVWESVGSWDGDEDLSSIQARLYTADGVPRGNQFQVNLSTEGAQLQPSVAGNPGGKYVVAWRDGEATVKARVLFGELAVFSDDFESSALDAWTFVSP